MANLSQNKRLDLEWFAVKRGNTDHHYIHLVVLGRCRNGTEVKIDQKDIDKAKEYGDRFLERHHPHDRFGAGEEAT